MEALSSRSFKRIKFLKTYECSIVTQDFESGQYCVKQRKAGFLYDKKIEESIEHKRRIVCCDSRNEINVHDFSIQSPIDILVLKDFDLSRRAHLGHLLFLHVEHIILIREPDSGHGEAKGSPLLLTPRVQSIQLIGLNGDRLRQGFFWAYVQRLQLIEFAGYTTGRPTEVQLCHFEGVRSELLKLIQVDVLHSPRSCKDFDWKIDRLSMINVNLSLCALDGICNFALV